MKANNNCIVLLFIFATLSLIGGVCGYLLFEKAGLDILITCLILALVFMYFGFRLHLKMVGSALIKVQEQSIRQEKMAQVGLLTAGIAHEIKNPLNFVNNFSRLTKELLDELKEALEGMLAKEEKATQEDIQDLLKDIDGNLDKLLEHGKRAENIVQNMLGQTRKTHEEKVLTDVNDLVAEYLNLAYHGMRAQNSDFNVKIEKSFTDNLPQIKVLPQPLGRTLLNLLNNAMYAAFSKKESASQDFMPTVWANTQQENGYIKITIKDNGTGIPKNLLNKIFEPFFTTKPAEDGTGLGLPICLEIVNIRHNGKLLVDSKVNEYTEFTIYLPINEKSKIE